MPNTFGGRHNHGCVFVSYPLVHLHAIALDDGCRRFAAKHLVVRARITAYSSKAKRYRLVADLVVKRVSELNSNDADRIRLSEHSNCLTTLLTGGLRRLVFQADNSALSVYEKCFNHLLRSAFSNPYPYAVLVVIYPYRRLAKINESHLIVLRPAIFSLLDHRVYGFF